MALETALVEACDIYYNRDCPVCRAEIDIYRRKAARWGLGYGFIDTNTSPDALADFGLSMENIKKRLYVVTPQGQARGGVDAFIEIWKTLPGWRWAARLLQVPGFYSAGAFLYDGLMAPVLYKCNTWREKKRNDEYKHIKTSG